MWTRQSSYASQRNWKNYDFFNERNFLVAHDYKDLLGVANIYCLWMWYVHHFIYFLFLLLVVFVFVRGGILKCSLCLQRMNQVCCCPKNHKRAKMFCIVLITFFIWWMVSLLWLTFTPFIVGVWHTMGTTKPLCLVVVVCQSLEVHLFLNLQVG